MNYKIAVITPKNKNDYLTNTVIDGLMLLKKESPTLEFAIPEAYPCDFDKTEFALDRGAFVGFASTADLIFFCWGKDNTDYDLAEEINRFDKTIFIDGSEVGRNRRFDSSIEEAVQSGSYSGNGKIDKEMLEKCQLYFRREKPYIIPIVPFPFGIESKYSKYCSPDVKKDIDFFCVFGQDEYPILRREVREELVKFCKENNLSYFADKTDRDNFYKILARSKVGISVGGGGFDTARFWEILGNNCLLLTETIDIYESDSPRLKYNRIWQFQDLADFKTKLKKMAEYLKNEYKQNDSMTEHSKIIQNHSTKSRVLEVIQKAKEKGIIE